ncbi:hypothetical protein [Micromonospora saelicesensis]|uniref:hypothetical protein n=1 Tax=Micromonospora saelicesensis TaxID=285676 RepID=UPI0015EC33BB|nr:hypothetical protein [Micromonospora saelicesensis]
MVNAGFFVPVIVGATSRRIVGCLFVDAALTSPAGPTPVAPPELLDFLRPKVTGGRLPQWTAWWDESDVALAILDVLGPDMIRCAASLAATRRRRPHRRPGEVPSEDSTRPDSSVAYGEKPALPAPCAVRIRTTDLHVVQPKGGSMTEKTSRCRVPTGAADARDVQHG